MIFEVEMLAFGDPGEVRKVEVPDENEGAAVDRVLESVFHYGQNDFQPQDHPSVSVGDVIRCRGENWMVVGVGFKRMTDEQLENYRLVDRQDRWRLQYDLAQNEMPE